MDTRIGWGRKCNKRKNKGIQRIGCTQMRFKRLTKRNISLSCSLPQALSPCLFCSHIFLFTISSTTSCPQRQQWVVLAAPLLFSPYRSDDTGASFQGPTPWKMCYNSVRRKSLHNWNFKVQLQQGGAKQWFDQMVGERKSSLCSWAGLIILPTSSSLHTQKYKYY